MVARDEVQKWHYPLEDGCEWMRGSKHEQTKSFAGAKQVKQGNVRSVGLSIRYGGYLILVSARNSFLKSASFSLSGN